MDHLFGGRGGARFRISIDPDVKSASPDSIVRSESPKNDFFSKPMLHSLYVSLNNFEVSHEMENKFHGLNNISNPFISYLPLFFPIMQSSYQ